jgi:hypothetical protein
MEITTLADKGPAGRSRQTWEEVKADRVTVRPGNSVPRPLLDENTDTGEEIVNALTITLVIASWP